MLDRQAASDERYRLLTMMSPDAISVVDITGRILDCNERFAELHGYPSSAELIGRNAAEFARPEEYQRLYARAAAAFQSGESIIHEVQVEIRRRDGSSRVTEYSVARVPWPGASDDTAFLSSIRDITAHASLLADLEARQARLEEEAEKRTGDLQAEIAKRARLEEMLRQRVQELSSLQALGQIVSFAHQLEDIIAVYLQRLVALASAETAELYLLNGEEFTRAGACLNPERSDAAGIPEGEPTARSALQAGGPVVVITPADAEGWEGDGGSLSWTLAAFPLHSGDAVVGALVIAGAGRDAFAARLAFLEMAADLIASRLHNALLHREMQERAAGLEELVAERTRELQTERDRTQAILETLGESVVVADNDGLVLFANPATVALTGYSRDEILGQPIWSRWTAQTLAKPWPEAQRSVRGGHAWHGEIAGRRKDGAVYTAALTGTPLYEASVGGAPIGSVWVQRDITTLKEAERLKDQFVSNVSHELRTPISIIALTCDNLEAFGARLDERERWQMMQEIHEQAHLLTSLADDILRISQIDSGRVAAPKLCVDLACLVSEEVDGQQPVAQQHRHRLSFSPTGRVDVMGNEIQLRQIIRNLLDNAIKFTPAGGQITCRCQTRDAVLVMHQNGQPSSIKTWAVIEVQDTGIGMAARELPLIFERFYRIQGETDVPGSGLGLPIAQELAFQHGGWIGVASTPAVGSTFSVYLPACGVESGQSERAGPAGMKEWL